MHRHFTGIVVSNAMTKTIVVEVESVVVHPIYKKRLRRHARYSVHAEKPSAFPIGATVNFEECRPLSKTKRWRVIEKLESKKEL